MKSYYFILLVFLTTNTFCQIQTTFLTEVNSNKPEGFYHMLMPDGHEQNFINAIVQDDIGQIWIATKDGLIRYNGKQKYFYKTNSNVSNPISHNNVTSLVYDKQNRLWVGTEKGLCLYRPKTDDFELISPKWLGQEHITDAHSDNKGNLWMINHFTNRLFKYNPNTKKLNLLIDNNLSDSYEKIHLKFFTISNDDKIYLSEINTGFVIYNIQTKSTQRINLDKGIPQNAYSFFGKILIDKHDKNIVWIATHLGFLLKYNLKTKQQEQLVYNTRLTNHHFHCYNFSIFQDNEDNVWVTTWFYGTFKILPDRKSYVHFLPNKDNIQTISNTVTTAVFQDTAGYMWFGTNSNGVDILKKNKKFFVYPSQANQKYSLPARKYLTVSKDTKNRVWMGSEGKLYYFDKKTLIGHKKINFNIDASRFFKVFHDSQNNMWLGTEKGAYQYDKNLNLINHFQYKKDDYQSVGSNFIVEIIEDKQHNIWLGSGNNGVTRYNPKTRKFYRFIHDNSFPNSLSNNYVTKIFSDTDNTIWIGTLDGLNRLHNKSGNFIVYRNNKNVENSISASKINDILEANGYLWIATQGGGLNRLDRKSGIFKSYQKRDGLPSNNVRSIQVDNHNNLWLSTTKNIVKFDSKNEKFTVFSKSDGLINNQYIYNLGWQDLQFTENFSYKDEKGYLYFGGISGIVFFHPDSLPKNTFTAPLIIEKFKVNGQKINISNLSKVTLQPNENQLEIDFTLMNLIQSDKNKYAWMLKPYDSTWHNAGYNSQAKYFNLPHGRYILHYKASNNDDVWSISETPLAITIKPHFYQTTLFYLSILFFVILLIVSFASYKWYIKLQIKKQKQKMRYTTSNLSPEKAVEINEKLLAAITTDSLYLEPDLNLHKLSDIIKVKPNYLSQVINQFHHQNFYEFINTYRIEEAKRLLFETSLKIEAVAYDSGFNSLSTFNAVFKKTVNQTPSRFRKQVLAV